MSSSSRSRPDRRAAVLAALVVVACVVQAICAGAAAAAELDVVAVVPSAADHQVSLVADIRPPPAAPASPDAFAVTAGGRPQPTRAAPVLSDQLAMAMVVDGSTGGAAELAAAASGAASFLLQLPPAAQTSVVVDRDPPAVLAAHRAGAADAVAALSSLRPGGGRSTSAAVTMALRQLPDASGPRVIVICTSAPDAGDEAVGSLSDRLRAAHVLLVAVTTAADIGYWSRVTADTGGLLVAVRPANVLAGFDLVARSLRGRYVVTFPLPTRLPADVSVRAEAPGGSITADARVPAVPAGDSGPAARPGPDRSHDGGSGLPWVLALVVGFGAVTLLAGFSAVRRRNRPAAPADQPGPGLPPD